MIFVCERTANEKERRTRAPIRYGEASSAVLYRPSEARRSVTARMPSRNSSGAAAALGQHSVADATREVPVQRREIRSHFRQPSFRW